MNMRRQQSIFWGLLIGIFLLIGIITSHYNTFWDITQTKKNTLSPISVKWAEQLEHPLQITAFTKGNPQLKKLIIRIIKQYQAYADIKLSFKNPDLSPDLAQTYQISREGEMLLTYNDKTVVSKGITEVFITKAISQLFTDKKPTIGWLTLNSQKQINQTDYPYAKAYQSLLTFAEIILINPSNPLSLPNHLDLLIVAEKEMESTASFSSLIQQQLKNGNNLFWLTHSNTSQDKLMNNIFGLSPSHQTVLSQKARPYGFKNHTIWSGYALSEKFPQIDTPIIINNISPINQTGTNKNWQYQLLLQEPDTVFLKQKNEISTSKKPLSLGWLMSKNQQEIVLLGSSSMIKNTLIHHGSNLAFFTFLAQKLTQQSNLPINLTSTLPPPILLSNEQKYSVNILLLLIFPLFILIVGLLFIHNHNRRTNRLVQDILAKKPNKTDQ